MAIVPYQTMPEWCKQGPSNRFGLCFYAMCGNDNVVLGRTPMPPVEIESAAREIEGFNPWIASTDTGENLPIGFGYIKENGWPGDPTLTIRDFNQISANEIAATTARRGFTNAWLMLPEGVDPGTYDFTDNAMARGASLTYAHAVAIVDQSAAGAPTFVTWAGLQTVSKAWRDAYFKQFFDVEWIDIT